MKSKIKADQQAPLSCIKVLDLSRVLAGPWVTQTLADMGATVVKIERPGVGDDTRSWGPPFYEVADGEDLSAYFMSANRGKQSVCIDLATEQGSQLVAQLAEQSDILVENFKVGDMQRRGLDYETLSATNAGLIYCSVTGFGQTGPYKDRPGYDFMIQGMAGLMSITGESDESSTDGPQKVGVALTDILTGLYSTIAILGALQERNNSGLGQYIDMALFDVLAASLANQASNYLVSGVAPKRIGNAHPNIVPYQTFATADGHIIIAVGNDAQFSRFCEAIGREDLATQEDYGNNARRVENRDALVAEIAAAMTVRSTAEWMVILQEAGVPNGPINDIQQMFNDPQARFRELAIKVAGMPLVNNPIKYSRSKMQLDKPPPQLGSDTKLVLEDSLGLSEDEIRDLNSKGIIR